MSRFGGASSTKPQARAPILEVIALTPEDAAAAEIGGADRLEIVRDIGTGGLTPELEMFQRIRDAVDLPLRVMLRTNAGFQVTAEEIDLLSRQVRDLLEAGADQFVVGFLDGRGALDLSAISSICSAIEPFPWTLHHAFDHATEPAIAWKAARELPRLDCVLSGGVRGDLGQGLAMLCDRATWQTDNLSWLAGGGLILDHVAPLREAGIRMFHIGRAARHRHSWQQPVNADAVRQWRQALDASG